MAGYVLALCTVGCVSTAYWPLDDRPEEIFALYEVPAQRAAAPCEAQPCSQTADATCTIPGRAPQEKTPMDITKTAKPITDPVGAVAIPGTEIQTATFALG